MQQNKPFRLMTWYLAVLLAAATRWPHADAGPSWATLLGVLLLGTLATVHLWPRAPRGIGAALLVSSLAFLLIPPSQEALLAWLPHPVVALAFVLALHHHFQDPQQRAPTVASHNTVRRSPILRFLPAMLGVTLLLVLPLAMKWLPLRIQATYELHTALWPLVPLAVIVAVLVVAASLRGLSRSVASLVKMPRRGSSAHREAEVA